MKKILIILTSALTISLIFIIIFLYKLDKREAEIINLKNRIEQDSLSYNNTTANDKWAYKFMSAGVRVIPEKDKIQIGDS